MLCSPCHREIHDCGVPRADQKTLVRSRPAGVRREIRAILGRGPRQCIPPDIDLAAVYAEACQVSGGCLNGSG